MSEAKMTERLFIRMDKPLKDELERISEMMGLTKSEYIRARIVIMPDKESSQVNQIMLKIKAEEDAWYEKHKESNNNGAKEPEQ